MGMLLYRRRTNGDYVNNFTKAEDVMPSVATPDVEVAEEVIEKVAETKQTYTRTQINRFSTDELKKLAKAEGLDSTLSGAKLKDLLIKHFGI